MVIGSLLPFEIYYENSAGSRLDFDREPIVMTESNIFDTHWSLKTAQHPVYDGVKLITRRRSCEPVELRLEVTAVNSTWLSIWLERLSDLLDHDTAAGTPGTLSVNGYYLRCWCVSSEKKTSFNFDSHATVKLTLMPEYPVWYREKQYRILGLGQTAGDGHKYPYKYPRRYGAGRRSVLADNSCVLSAPVRITFYGEAVDPRLYLGSQCMGLDVNLAAGEYAVIDQLSREIYSVSSSGDRTNRFDSRDRGGGVFTYLPSGKSLLTLDSDGGVDITMYERRSEPPWA